MYYIIKSLHLSCFYSLYPTGPEASWVQITSPGNATEIYMNGHFYFAKVFMSALKVCFYLVSLFVCVSDFFPCIWCTLSFEQNSTRVSSIKRCEQDNCRILLEVFWVSGFFGCKSQISKFYISLFMFLPYVDLFIQTETSHQCNSHVFYKMRQKFFYIFQWFLSNFEKCNTPVQSVK
mgnify:CR=1 FL=1